MGLTNNYCIFGNNIASMFYPLLMNTNIIKKHLKHSSVVARTPQRYSVMFLEKSILLSRKYKAYTTSRILPGLGYVKVFNTHLFVGKTNLFLVLLILSALVSTDTKSVKLIKNSLKL